MGGGQYEIEDAKVKVSRWYKLKYRVLINCLSNAAADVRCTSARIRLLCAGSRESRYAFVVEASACSDVAADSDIDSKLDKKTGR